MKILLYVNSKQNLKKSNNLGGIEILNYDLFNFLKEKYFTILTNSLTAKIKNINWDIVISSNDSNIFNLVNTKRNVLWLHNKLQIEKALWCAGQIGFDSSDNDHSDGSSSSSKRKSANSGNSNNGSGGNKRRKA